MRDGRDEIKITVPNISQCKQNKTANKPSRLMWDRKSIVSQKKHCLNDGQIERLSLGLVQLG